MRTGRGAGPGGDSPWPHTAGGRYEGAEPAIPRQSVKPELKVIPTMDIALDEANLSQSPAGDTHTPSSGFRTRCPTYRTSESPARSRCPTQVPDAPPSMEMFAVPHLDASVLEAAQSARLGDRPSPRGTSSPLDEPLNPEMPPTDSWRLPVLEHDMRPQTRENFMTFVIQLLILLTGVNLAFLLDTAGPFLVDACGFGGVAGSVSLFVLQMLLILVEALSLVQTMRVHTLLYSTGPYKNHATTSWVLHHMKLRDLLNAVKERFLGDKKFSSTKALAKELFAHLDSKQNGVITASEFHSHLIEHARTQEVSTDEVLGMMRHMDKDGYGYIDFDNFYLECRYIFDQ